VAEQLYRMLMTPSGDGSSQRLADRNGCPVFISRTNALSLQRLEHIRNVPYQRDWTEYGTLWRHEILRYKSNISQIVITCSPSDLSSYILFYWRIRECGRASVWNQYGQASV